MPASSAQSISSTVSPIAGPQSPTTVLQQIADTVSKRTATLEYIKDIHRGEGHHYQTIRITNDDLKRMPYYKSDRLVRRATSFFFLGNSLFYVLDVTSHNLFEYMRSLSSLLTEFETYLSLHPPEGPPSSLSKAKIPAVFRRATQGNQMPKGRRGSAAHEIGLPMGSTNDPHQLKLAFSGLDTITANAASTTPVPNASNIPDSDPELVTGESYTFLRTMALPMDLDFVHTFETLSDTLILCYNKIVELLIAPANISPAIFEAFTKVDARIKKLIIHGPLKEFEEFSRAATKTELAGLAKLTLGGLI